MEMTHISGGSDGKESACNAGDLGLILGWDDPLEKEMATRFSILAWKIPMDRGAWRATVHEVVKSRILSTSKHMQKNREFVSTS